MVDPGRGRAPWAAWPRRPASSKAVPPSNKHTRTDLMACPSVSSSTVKRFSRAGAGRPAQSLGRTKPGDTSLLPGHLRLVVPLGAHRGLGVVTGADLVRRTTRVRA